MTARREREAFDMAAMVGRVSRSMVRRAADGEIEVLTALRQMRADVDAATTAAIRELHAWNDGALSLSLIASEMGVTKQAVHKAIHRQPGVDAS